MLIARRRWKPEHHAVSRHLNKAADALATRGVFDALKRFHDGSGDDEIRAWCDKFAFEQRGWSIPTSILNRPNARLTFNEWPCGEALPRSQNEAAAERTTGL